MAPPGGRRRYIVAERESFNSDWRRGVAEGWINPMTDPTVLNTIIEHLSLSPRAARQVSGWPDSIRVIRFPRSAVHEHGRLEIRYEIIEDDRTVWLDRILPVEYQEG